MKLHIRLLTLICATALAIHPTHALADNAAPTPQGKLVDLGGHKLHVNCTGQGGPTVVVEVGLGDFSFDWSLVQSRVSRFTRICTYDRAGYAWSDPGPLPRTFDQINLELRDALQKLGESAPYVLVGHSYGGPVARNFALTYPRDVVGLVLVDAAHEGMRVQVGPNMTIRLGADARAREIPTPHEQRKDSDVLPMQPADQAESGSTLEAMYKVLPAAEQKLQLWAQQLPAINATEASQREWSEQYFARLLAKPQAGSLGNLPVMVLSRAHGGYDKDADVTAAQMEQERKDGQAMLAHLSSNSRQIILNCGHNMNLEAPADVAAAIRRVVEAARHSSPL